MSSFVGRIHDIPEHVRREMRGVSHHPHADCPPFAALRLLCVSYLDFEDVAQQGELVVAHEIAEATVSIFARLFALRFPIARMQRIEAYGGDDGASMAANNTSAFNFRTIDGSHALSHHALGLAIDINPVQNPWVRGIHVEPAAGRAFLDRSQAHQGLITADGPVTALFAAHGFHWGGEWPDMQDYHHFSRLPRGARSLADARSSR